MAGKPVYINSDNDIYQIFTSIRDNRNKRRKYGNIFVEGVIPVNMCLKSGAKIDSIIINRDKLLSDWAQNIVDTAVYSNLYSLKASLLEKLSGKEIPSELILIAEYPDTSAACVDITGLKKIVLLDRPISPGNLGTMIRSCDAFAIDLILISGHGADPYDPAVISASRGTVFNLPPIQIASNQELLQIFKRLKKENPGFTIYGTSAGGSEEIDNVAFVREYCLLIGNETYGLNENLRNLADAMIRIPMQGAASSLNIACALTLFLYAIDRYSR
ncbi:MAG: hypothetical protein JW996_05235 [Candidatus Cloacimonetes bacterium]|nr:hypothetical protein [Candidatus Cloacimonadota bacterium]